MMDFPFALIGIFPPSEKLLLDCARRFIDDDMLMDIAKADYGYKAEEVLQELRPIRDKGVIPTLMNGMLIEVLSLTRWSDPDKPNSPPFEPGPSGLRGHQTRFFACATLLRADGEDHSNGSSLALCLVSAKELGEEMNTAIGSFLTWQLTRAQRHCDSLLFAVGLLVVAIRLRFKRITNPVLADILEWVLAEEERDRRDFALNLADPRPIDFSLQQGFWQPLCAELKSEAATMPLNDLRTNLELCALILEPF